MKEIILSFLEKPILYDFDKLTTIVCMNKDIYIDIVKSFFNGNFDSKKVLDVFNNGVQVTNNEYIFIPNVLSLDINSKKNINALYKLLKSKYAITFNNELHKIKEIIEQITNEIGVDFEINVTAAKTIDVEDVLKISSLMFEENYDNVLVKGS